jgi:hypothetical protein
MTTLWDIVRKKNNREIISWLSGGPVVVIAGLWAAFVYFSPPKKDDGGSIKVARIIPQLGRAQAPFRLR